MSVYDCPPKFENPSDHEQWLRNRRSIHIAREAMNRFPPIKIPHVKTPVPQV